MKRAWFFVLLAWLAGPVRAQGIFEYDAKSANGDNVGIFAGMAVNNSAPMIKRLDGWSHTAKGAMSLVPSIGVYGQKSIGSRLSIRGGFSFGYSSYAFRYSQSYDSLTENLTPALSSKFSKYTKVKHGSGYVMPQIDLGYLMGPFNKMYLVEIRGGVGMPVYLAQAGDTIVSAAGSVTDSRTKYVYNYRSTERALYGQPGRWGSLVAHGYVGMRWQKTSSQLLNRLAVGIQANITFYTNAVGYAELEYKNESYVVISRERVDLGMFNFGIRVGYDFL